MSVCLADATAYLRVASLAVAAYDWLWTLVAEGRMYRNQPSFMRMSRGCILFILIRYTSIFAIVTSNVGFFAHGFSVVACHRYYLLSPAMKAIQATVSQSILFVRTYAVSRRAPWVFWTLSILFSVSIIIEFWSNLWLRIPIQNTEGSCTSGNNGTLRIAWVHYLAVMIYDGTCLSIATYYIYVQSASLRGLDGLSRMILEEGLLYFCLLAAVNIFNLILYHTATPSAQSSGATLGYAITWIMSQRILIHLQDFSSGRGRSHSRSRTGSNRDKGVAAGTTGTRAVVTRSLAGAARSPFGKPSFFGHTQDDGVEELELGGVQVTVEETVKVDYGAQSPVLGRSVEKDEEESVDSRYTNTARQNNRIVWDQGSFPEGKK